MEPLCPTDTQAWVTGDSVWVSQWWRHWQRPLHLNILNGSRLPIGSSPTLHSDKWGSPRSLCRYVPLHSQRLFPSRPWSLGAVVAMSPPPGTPSARYGHGSLPYSFRCLIKLNSARLPGTTVFKLQAKNRCPSKLAGIFVCVVHATFFCTRNRASHTVGPPWTLTDSIKSLTTCCSFTSIGLCQFHFLLGGRLLLPCLLEICYHCTVPSLNVFSKMFTWFSVTHNTSLIPKHCVVCLQQNSERFGGRNCAFFLSRATAGWAEVMAHGGPPSPLAEWKTWMANWRSDHSMRWHSLLITSCGGKKQHL